MSGDDPSVTHEKDEDTDRGAAAPKQERRRWQREQQGRAPVPGPKSPALRPLEFSTRDLPAREQFAAWQAHMASLVDIRLPDDVSPAAGFSADHKAWNLGSVILVQQRVPAHSYMRSIAKLRTSPLDHWYAALLRSGRTWTEVDGSVAENEAGKAEFGTLGYPFRGRALDAESTILYMPRDLFPDSASALEASNNSILSGNLGNLLFDYVNSIEAALDSLAAEDLPGIARTLREIVTVCLSSSAATKRMAEQHSVGLMERARRYIHQNLASPELTPDSLCHELGISRTRLYQLFEPSGGVLHYIRRRRLLASHAALSDPGNDERILEIAEAAGFDTPANFSRAFKTEFGYSPREARELGASWRGAGGASPIPGDADTFEAWLAGLGG